MRFLKRTSLIPRSTSINTRVKKAKRKLLVEQLEARRLLAGMYISEIQSNPLFGNADTDQYVELRGTPNATIPTGTYFVAIEGWGAVPGGPGYLHSMIDLSNLTFGANGFLTVTQFGNPYQIDPQSARLVSTSTAFSGLPDGRWSDASTISDRFSHVASASLNFMLIVTPDKPVPGVDYDVEDDGQLDSSTTSSWTILDSVAMMGYTPTPGWSYSGITFSSLTTNHRVPAGTVSIVQEGVGYVARIGSSTGYSADDWVGGTSIEDKINLNSKYRFTYGTFGDPRPLVYSGRATNDIGTYNFGGGFLGTAAIDTDRDGVITKSDTPLAGVTLFADRNDNGIRDTTTVDVISAQQTLGAELANTFPNATLTVADSNNKNIGFAVRTAQTTDNGSNTIRVLSSEGIPWFDTGSRLKVMFYREAQSVSIEAIAAETLKVSYGRIDLYDKNNNLLTSKSTSPLAGTSREVISINRPTADIKYAIIYTDTTLANTSPFGKFDKLRYSYPEFQTATGADGSFRLEELPVGSYRLTVGSYPGNLIPITAGSSSPLNVTKSEHLTDLVFGYKQNLPPEIQSTQFNVAENPATNAVVATVLATDPDAGQTLTYRFTSNSGQIGRAHV